ncbi:MAG: SusC/RagA family TonB-linked outer membrane protein [Janthinobacterium lividum]
MRKHLFWVILLLAGFCQQAWAQDRSISGKITDRATGQGLPGVTIIVKGLPTIGTSTNSDGVYSLSVPSTATALVYSFVGYSTQEAPITGSGAINIALASDTKQLNEVVVTALGVERNRNSLAFAATQVDGSDITVARNPNPINGLEGKVAGLNVQQTNTLGGSSNVIIRGIKSIGNNNQALFVVDGVPISNQNTNSANQQTGRSGYDYGNAAADINPDDIATTTVLKGAAASALYGERAANGVILITTKKGRRSGLGVTINTGITFGRADLSTFIHYQKQYGAGYGQYYGDPKNPGYFDFDASGTRVVPTYEDASYGGGFDPTLNVRQWYSYIPGSPTFGQATPWVAASNDPSTFFRTAVSNLNSVVVDGGSEQGTFKLGYSGNNEQGYLVNSNINRQNVNFAGSLNVTPRLTVSTSINFSRTTGLGRYGTGYGSENPMTNFRQWWQTNVDVKELESAYNLAQNPANAINNGNATWNLQNPTAGNYKAIFWNNPYFVRYQNYEQDSRYRTFGNMTATYKFADWFNVLGRVSADSYDEMQEERSAVGSTTASYLPYYSRYNHTYREFNYDLIGNFSAKISDNFSFRGLVGANMRRVYNTSIFGSTVGGLTVPNLYTLNNSVSPINPTETYVPVGVDGIFANATFGFLDRVFLDLTIRRDKSTILPVNSNTYYYPSAALGYVFSESLKEQAPWLSYGKVRANVAQVGSAPAAQALFDTYTKPTAFGSTALFSLPNTKNNAGLKNETTRSVEVGVETSFLNSRLGFEATVYQQNSIDQQIAVNIPASTGYLYRYVNAGNIRNRGIEITAFVSPVQTTDFKWTVNANWTRNENIVQSLYSGDNLVLATYQQGITSNATVGQAYGSLRGTDFIYDTNGNKVVGADGYYSVTSDANHVIGNPTPRWRGGITNTFTYKGISLNFLIDIKSGGQIYSLDRAYGLDTGLTPETAGLNDKGNPSRNTIANGGGVILPGVKADGTPNDVRVENSATGLFGYEVNPNAAFVYDASFVKLREAALTFSLPATLLSKIAVKGIDISVVGRNLWIIHKNLPDADPEDVSSSGNLGQGFQGGAYPTMRTLGANLRLRF